MSIDGLKARISRLGFGCSSVWGLPRFSDDRAEEIVNVAIDCGIRYFDTGPSYGVAESRLGSILRARRDADVVISTKVGTESTTEGGRRSFAPERIQRSVEGSLSRLGVDYIDILYLHGPSIEDLNEDTVACLFELRKAGKVKFLGINSFDGRVLGKAVALPFEIFMVQYNIVDRTHAPLIETISKAGKVAIGATSMAQAIYSPMKFSFNGIGAWYFLRALKNAPSAIRAAAKSKIGLHDLHSMTHEVALKYALDNEFLVSSVFGSSNPEHIRENARLAGLISN